MWFNKRQTGKTRYNALLACNNLKMGKRFFILGDNDDWCIRILRIMLEEFEVEADYIPMFDDETKAGRLRHIQSEMQGIDRPPKLIGYELVLKEEHS